MSKRTITDADLNAYTDTIDAGIQVHGHVVHFTLDDHGVSMAYSVGRAEQGHPEFIVFGLNPKLSFDVVNATIQELDRTNRTPSDGAFVVLNGMQYRFHNAYGAQATHMYQSSARLDRIGMHPMFDAFQILWPDTNGKFPEEIGYETKFVQPLYRIPTMPN